MGTHRIEVQPAQKGERGAFRVRDLANEPIAEQRAIESGITGELIPAPEGNIRQYLRNHLSELGGEDAYVKLAIHYKAAPGEQRPTRLLSGWRVLADG